MRRWLTFESAGVSCASALDEGGGTTGVVIVSGGTELACGAHGGMGQIAAALAERGACVLRFDRPGVGDSMGVDRGFEASAPVIVDAVHALTSACVSVRQVVLVGNCDAAAALLLAEKTLTQEASGAGLAIAALVLSNIWLDDRTANGSDALPSPAAIRDRYLTKLASPREWWRLISGGVDLHKLFAGLSAAAKPATVTGLTERLAAAAEHVSTPVTVLLAADDATAIAFADACSRQPLKSATRQFDVRRYASRSHSFSTETDRRLLVETILSAGDG